MLFITEDFSFILIFLSVFTRTTRYVYITYRQKIHIYVTKALGNIKSVPSKSLLSFSMSLLKVTWNPLKSMKVTWKESRWCDCIGNWRTGELRLIRKALEKVRMSIILITLQWAFYHHQFRFHLQNFVVHLLWCLPNNYIAGSKIFTVVSLRRVEFVLVTFWLG